ncbi:DUF3558 domain-containing protein [Nocardia sp. CA-135398]|uniref:DUF3558 domain-containing protein n=1 Tax=Nocardia sp. CA-135398 TaxID=3239977 RepID=UPI003D98ED8C
MREDEMASWSGVVRGVVLGAGLILLVSACNPGGESKGTANSASATPTIAADVPAGFDACKDLPQTVIQQEHLIKPDPDKKDGAQGIKWRGCGWIQAGGDGYAATIDTTNITLAMVRANHDFAVDEELTVAGRAALTSHVSGQDPHADCVINVELKGGSLEISIDNPPSRRNSGNQHSCEIAKRLAEGIVPAIPAAL